MIRITDSALESKRDGYMKEATTLKLPHDHSTEVEKRIELIL